MGKSDWVSHFYNKYKQFKVPYQGVKNILYLIQSFFTGVIISKNCFRMLQS